MNNWLRKGNRNFLWNEETGEVLGYVSDPKLSTLTGGFYRAYAVGHGKVGHYVSLDRAQIGLEKHVANPPKKAK